MSRLGTSSLPGPGSLRRTMEAELKQLLTGDPKELRVRGIESEEAYGHLAGSPLEIWLKEKMTRFSWKVAIYFPNEFVDSVLKEFRAHKRESKEVRELTWWGNLLVSQQQLRDFADGKPLQRWQQEAADIVLHYGQDLWTGINDVILLNVKSHSLVRESRPPNIMSAQRLLEFLNWLLNHETARTLMEKTNYWFVGISWELAPGPTGLVREIHVRDLFKLDVKAIPQINFDAAIQIQWHVKDMTEIPQDKLAFVEGLATVFNKAWEQHSRQKQLKYSRLVDEIKTGVGRLRDQTRLSQ